MQEHQAFGVKSGFYQTSNPINFPSNAAGWWHLLDVRHTNPSNNFAMQFAGGFYDQNLYFRKTSNLASQQWNKILIENPQGKVGIGGDPNWEKLTINGGHEGTAFLMSADNGTNPHGYLSLWASEPGVTYNGVGIGNNVRNYYNGQIFTRINVGKGASFIRLLENEINFNLISESGNLISPLKLHSNGNVSLQGKLEAKEVKVTTSPTADFVFEETYDLPKLDEVEKFIKENKHLPEIASAKVMEKEGVNIGEFQIKLLQKIEELTLYTIEQNKLLKQQTEENKIQQEKILSLEKLVNELLSSQKINAHEN